MVRAAIHVGAARPLHVVGGWWTGGPGRLSSPWRNRVSCPARTAQLGRSSAQVTVALRNPSIPIDIFFPSSLVSLHFPIGKTSSVSLRPF